MQLVVVKEFTQRTLLKGRVNTKTLPEIHPWKLLKQLFPPFGPDLKYPFQSPPRPKKLLPLTAN